MKVVITGAAGNVGLKLVAHFARQREHELTLLDRHPADLPGVSAADLSRYDAAWVRAFENQDAVIHLARSRDDGEWDPLLDSMDMTINVFRAAVEQRVPRIVFASTVRVASGYREPNPIAHSARPRPVSYYAMTKVFGEQLGRSLAAQHDLSVICLRLGTVWPGDNQPQGKGFVGQRRWLSNRDLGQAFDKALTVADVRFAALFVTSDNDDKEFDLAGTERVLGFRPDDRVTPHKRSVAVRLLRRLRRRWRQPELFERRHGTVDSD